MLRFSFLYAIRRFLLRNHKNEVFITTDSRTHPTNVANSENSNSAIAWLQNKLSSYSGTSHFHAMHTVPRRAVLGIKALVFK